MRGSDDRRWRASALALALGAICAAVGFESWWTPPPIAAPVAQDAATRVESECERALRESDARRAAIQRLIDELRASMKLEFSADDLVSVPRGDGRAIVPACAAATCPELQHIRRPPILVSDHALGDLSTRLDESVGELAALIERLATRERDVAGSR